MDEAAQQTVLRQFPYGLYAVAVRHEGEEHGMTANWVTQTAFVPPLRVVPVHNKSKTIGVEPEGRQFAEDQLQQGHSEHAEELIRPRATEPVTLERNTT